MAATARTTIFIMLMFAVTTSITVGQQRTYPPSGVVFGPDMMDVRNFSLLEYRRLFSSGTTPTNHELRGHWRGVNKGIVTLVGYKQFVKEIQPCGQCYFGENIKVHQVSSECLRCIGWMSKVDSSGNIEREGRFAVQPANGRGPFGHGTIFSYREGGNRKSDPARLLVDKVVKIDETHLLGRATAKFGLVQIPLAFFVLERIQ